MRTSLLIAVWVTGILAALLIAPVLNSQTFASKPERTNQLCPEGNPATGSISIAGHVYGTPGGAPLDSVDVMVFNKTSMSLQSEVFTDGNGYFNAQFVYVGLGELTAGPNDRIYSNPGNDQMIIEFNAEQGGTYLFLIYDVSGREIYKADIYAAIGGNKLTLVGGNIGLHLIEIVKNSEKHVFKSLKTLDSGVNFSYRITQEESSDLKSIIKNQSSWDSVYVVFSKNGFVTGDTTLAPFDQVVDKNLKQIPAYAINTTFKPFDVNGNPANITITAHWPDGTTGNYSPNSNNEIVIQKDLYTANATATLELDSVAFVNNRSYLSLFMGRLIHQAIEDSNLFQSPKEWNQFAQPVNVDMSNPNINGHVIYNYVIPKYVPDETKPGDSIRMDSHTVIQMMTSRSGAGGEISRYIPISDPTKQPFYQFRLAYNKSDNTPMSQTQIDRMKTWRDVVYSMSPVPNTNDTIFLPFTDYVVNTSSDPIYTQRVTSNVQQDDQFIQLFYFNGLPESGVSYKNTYTPNNESRASFGFANNYRDDGDVMVFAEVYKVITTTADPQGNSSSGYIWSTTLNGPSLLAYTMARAEALLNLNTKY